MSSLGIVTVLTVWSLDRLHDDLPALLLGLLVGMVHDLLDQGTGLLLALVLNPAEQQFLRLIGAEASQLKQPFLLLGQDLLQLILLLHDPLFAGRQPGFQVVQVLFLNRQRVELSVERVLSFGQALFEALELVAGALGLALEVLFPLEGLGPGGELDLLGLGFAGALGILADARGFVAGPGDGVLGNDGEERDRRPRTDSQADDQQQCFDHFSASARAGRKASAAHHAADKPYVSEVLR
jgi:hypothetical protein